MESTGKDLGCCGRMIPRGEELVGYYHPAYYHTEVSRGKHFVGLGNSWPNNWRECGHGRGIITICMECSVRLGIRW